MLFPTGDSVILSQVPSTAFELFNLSQEALITSSLLIISLVSSCHTRLYAASSVPVFLTVTTFVVVHPGLICSATISGESV